MVGFGRLWKSWEGFGRLWEVLECIGRFWEALAASVNLCKALVQWMLWKVLEALEGTGSIEGFWKSFGRLKGFGKL